MKSDLAHLLQLHFIENLYLYIDIYINEYSMERKFMKIKQTGLNSMLDVFEDVLLVRAECM